MTGTSFLVALLAVAIATAQEQKPSFEVASIRLHPGTITFSSDPAISGSRVTGTAITLVDMLTYAYRVKYDQISGGPNWASVDHYDIAARAEGDGVLGEEAARAMFQALLADRFKLKIHRETKDLPVFALVVGKNGPKLKNSSPDADGNSFVTASYTGLIHMVTARGTMEGLARQLSNTAGRPVLDKTGLTAFYAYTLDWLPADRASGSDSEAASMFTAVQQLGLKLESAKAPYEVLVIDQAAKPSEN
jgi:uncharacterized protein (TIGR03435 family)